MHWARKPHGEAFAFGGLVNGDGGHLESGDFVVTEARDAMGL
jgi:hypothetical protein